MEPPDPLEKRIRFGCGSLFGLIFGCYAAFKTWPENMYVDIALVIIIILTCGTLAMKQGDGFWHELTNFHWWRW
jgi:hypothetical protein